MKEEDDLQLITPFAIPALLDTINQNRERKAVQPVQGRLELSQDQNHVKMLVPTVRDK